MAGPDGNASEFLSEAIASPHALSFFQLVRRLECARGELPPVGMSKRPVQDVVRFAQPPSLAFAPSAIARIETGSHGKPPTIFCHFMGLLGPNGPLPLHITEYIYGRAVQEKDHTPARFLDLFNHRAISLLYRAWSIHQRTVSFESGNEDRFAMYLGAMFGLGLDAARNRDAVPDLAKLFYAGRLANQSRNPEGLAAILHDDLGVPAAIEEFVGQWLSLPEENQCRLGDSPETGLLGQTLIVGSKIFDRRQKFRIVLGPMPLQRYEQLLPGSRGFKRLTGWVHNYCFELSWDVQLVLKKEEAPPLQLGTSGRLGWTTWLRSRPLERDADQLILQPESFAAASQAAA